MEIVGFEILDANTADNQFGLLVCTKTNFFVVVVADGGGSDFKSPDQISHMHYNDEMGIAFIAYVNKK